MSRYYPVALDLRNRPCLVIGGGSVAEAKVEGLLDAGARVTVVSPTLSERLASWAIAGRITHRQREYDSSDLDRQQLVFSATDSRDVTQTVAADARLRGLWMNAADDPTYCNAGGYRLPSRPVAPARRWRRACGATSRPISLPSTRISWSWRRR